MGLQNLTDVHASRHTQGVKNDIHGGAICQEWHILYGDDLGNDALVTVASSHFVACHNLAALRHADAHDALHARRQVAVFVPIKDFDIHNLAASAMGHPQAGIFHIAQLLTEDGAQQFLLGSELFLTLWRDLAHQDIQRTHLSANPDDAFFVQITQRVIGDVGNLAGDLFGSEFGVARGQLVLFDMHGGEFVILDKPLAQQDGILIVAALPGDESHENILSQCQAAAFGGGAICQDVAALHALSLAHHRALVNTGALVGAAIFAQLVAFQAAIILRDHHTVSGDAHHHALFLRYQHQTGVSRRRSFHASANKGRLRQ